MIARGLPAAVLVFTGMALALVIGETAARMSFAPADVMTEPDPRLGWRYIPGRSGWYSDSMWKFEGTPRIPVRINREGLLDREYPLEKPQGVRRILVLADSFGGDFGVPFGALFPKAAEVQANSGSRRGRQEVINAGVSGFGTGQELLMFRTLGRKYHPDLVLLCFYMNDVGDNLDPSDRRPRFFLRGGRPISQPPRLAVSAPGSIRSLSATRFLNDHSRLFWLVRERLVRTPATRRFLARMHLLNPRVTEEEQGVRRGLAIFLKRDDPVAAAGWELTEALIRQLGHDVEAGGARLAVMIAPMESQVYPDRFPALWRQYFPGVEYDLDKPNRTLDGFLAAEQIPFLDLLPILRARGSAGEADLYRRGNGHWTAKGHMIAGAALVDFLSREGLMERGRIERGKG